MTLIATILFVEGNKFNLNTVIKTTKLQNCPACQNIGIITYQGLNDSMLDTEGSWSMRKCSSPVCGTYWLDPTPIPEDIPKLYPDYQTHTDPPAIKPTKPRGVKLFMEVMRQSVLAQELGYPSDIPKKYQRLLSNFSRIHPGWRDEQLNQVLYVPYVINGEFLDVGCGGGYAMMSLKNKGFNVTGTDFDEEAVKNAQRKGLRVFHGDLKNINFKENSFDVILLCHVIEHVPNPIEFLKECRRILKPGGYLIAITPNAASRGHNKFKESWRGLEVPRHLQVFTPHSLSTIGVQAGFNKVIGKTCIQGFSYLTEASKMHSRTGSFNLQAQTKTEQIVLKIKLFIFGIFFAISPGKEETALLVCQK